MIKRDIVKKIQAYKGGLYLEEKKCIQEHTENKLLNKNSKMILECM